MTIFSFPDQVNERAARIVATGVVVATVSAIATQSAWLLPILAAGFVLRWCFGPAVSPLARLAVYVAPKLAAVRLVAGPPKRFAQAIGAVCFIAASFLVLVAQSNVGWAVAAVVAVCATLEAAAGFCMGCWIYGKLIGAGLVAAEHCDACARVGAGR